jgi:outer membrane protein TolC
MRKNLIIFSSFIFFSCSNLFAQEKKVLSISDFIDKVKAHHPLAKVANIQVEKANADLLAAKGGFDPLLAVETTGKTFDKKDYYTYNDAEIKVPLPIGDLKTGIENNRGQFINTEFSSGRSSYLGMELPLAKGLLIDKRRAVLQQAKIAIQQNTATQKALINDLLLDAYLAYYQWAGATKIYNIFSNYVQVSNARLKLVKISVENGDRAAMDSIEAITQLQNFEMLQADALVKLTNATLDMNNFVWDNNGIPQNIESDVIADSTFFETNNNMSKLGIAKLNNSLQNPLLQQYKYKIDGLQVEKKLKFQSLLPTVNVMANLLNKDYFIGKNFGMSLLENNNKWGIQVKMPFFFREGRGAYKMAKLKIEESTLELKQKTQEFENKIKMYYNEYYLLQNQLGIANNAYKNFYSLLRNEVLRFNNGESSLFFVNSRENKVFEMEQKIIELKLKLLKAKYTLDWAMGNIQ